MQVLLLPVGCGITGPCFICGAYNWDDRWACPLSCLTPDPCQVPCWAWQVKGEAMAVNGTDYTSVIVWTVGEGDVDVVVRCCSAHTGNEVNSCVGGVVEQS